MQALLVCARVGGSLSHRSAVPVKAHGGRVVVECACCRVQDCLDDVLHGFARVHICAGGEHGCDVDVGGVALDDAVGEEHEAVTGLQRQALDAVVVSRHG